VEKSFQFSASEGKKEIKGLYQEWDRRKRREERERIGESAFHHLPSAKGVKGRTTSRNV